MLAAEGGAHAADNVPPAPDLDYDQQGADRVATDERVVHPDHVRDVQTPAEVMDELTDAPAADGESGEVGRRR